LGNIFYHILVLVGAYKKIGTGSRVISLIFSEYDCHRKQLETKYKLPCRKMLGWVEYRRKKITNFSDSTGLGVSHRNRQIIGNISTEFSLKVGNHQVSNLLWVGNRSLNGCVGDSRLASVDGWQFDSKTEGNTICRH
jgi:hypothetical protein